jgi:hypothetical protein
MPTIDSPQLTAFHALYLGHDPQRHALMNQPDHKDKYTTIHRPIRDQHITGHLRGFLTLAAPLIGPDGLAQTVALDVDAGGCAALQRALDAAQALGWTAYGITSTNEEHDGGHLWIHLDQPTTPDRARLLAQTIADAAQVRADLYPTGLQLRLPLGVHRWSNQRGTLLLQDGTTLDLDSGDAAITQALEMITCLPRNSTDRLPEIAIQPRPARSPHTHLTTRQKPAGSAKDAIQTYNQATDLIDLLESFGGRIAQRVSGGGVLMHCPCGGHSHGDRKPSLEIKPARSARYGRYIAVGYSSNCQFFTERGQVLAPFDVLCKLDNLTNVEALKRINPCRAATPTRSRPAPEPEPDWTEPTPEERAETAEQRRKRIAEAQATHAEIQARIEADHQLSARARAIMHIMLTWAVNRAWCRLSTARIAKDHLHVSERTIQRGMRELERRGYIESTTHTTHDGRTYQGGWSTTVRRFLRVTHRETTCHPCIKLKEDLNPKEFKACERPPDSAPWCSSSSEAEPIACEGGASYTPADDWTLTPHTAPDRKPWRASVLPKDFFTLYRAARERTAPGEWVRQVVEHRQADEQPNQAVLELADNTPMPSTEAQAQLGNIEAQIWRTPPTDPKKRRTYYVLKRKAEQVERTNPKQARALRMQARNLEEVSDLLITATSCTADELHHPDADHRQVEVAPVTPRPSSESRAPRSLLPGIQFRPRLVTVTTPQPHSTSVHAAAAPGMTGGRSHAQTSVKPGEIDEKWLTAKQYQADYLQRQDDPKLRERGAWIRALIAPLEAAFGELTQAGGEY